MVARAWADPAYKQRLLDYATAAIAERGFGGLQGESMIAIENTPDLHNVVVCALCSCYPWPTLGLPPMWAVGIRRLPGGRKADQQGQGL